jgi:hypothetical protein
VVESFHYTDSSLPYVGDEPISWNSRIPQSGEIMLSVHSEQDVVHHVRNYLECIISALGLNLMIGGEIGIKHIRPDLCALRVDNHIVGVVEVKLPGDGVLVSPTVVGELYDQMMLVRGFYGTGPVCGVLTTGREWKVFWFPQEGFSQRDSSEEGLTTPVKGSKKPLHSPVGGTPSQQRGVAHRIELEDENVGEKEGYQDAELCRHLISTPVILSEADELLPTLCSALSIMSRARSGFFLDNSIFLFKICKDSPSLTWHPTSYEDAVSRVNFDRYPRRNTRNLLALEDLGHGSSGRCWLCVTTAISNAAVCVLKYRNDPAHAHKLTQEFEKWQQVYPQMNTRVENWCGTLALMMPHFAPILEQHRPKFKDPIRCLLREAFHDKGLMHQDVRWRNIGSFKDSESGEVPILFDLESVVNIGVEGNDQWIESAMCFLYPEDESELS